MVSSLQVYGKLFFPSSLEYGCVITAHDEELHMEKVFKLLKAHGPHFQYIYSRLRKAKGIFFASLSSLVSIITRSCALEHQKLGVRINFLAKLARNADPTQHNGAE